ncbi:MAG: hypothetical protein RJA70_5050, partial [Pseudomonadota bacterium]
MSKFEFKLPDIGEGVSEGEIVSWLVSAGDSVTEDQDMVEVMTDKATVTIGAPTSGKVTEVRAAVGETVPVGTVIVVIESADVAAPAPAAPAPAVPASAPTPVTQAETKASAVGDIREDLPGMGGKSPTAPTGGTSAYFSDKPLAAPATRKLARELGVDLRQVPPSGEAGRVTADDVKRHAGGSSQVVVANSAPSAVMPLPSAVPAAAPIAPSALEERVPIRGMRKRIYESMARSKRTAAHFTYVDDCECTNLIALRNRLKAGAEAEKVRLNYLPFIVKAVVAALKKHPYMNCLVDDSSGEMVLRKNYDIGIAVATEQGLIVPVLRNADGLNLLEISSEIDRLASEARAGKARREDLGGSSFTITSLGKAGGLLATPVVNYPEVGILFVPEMKKVPVVKGDQIVVGHVMNLSLSFDHRIIDGNM